MIMSKLINVSETQSFISNSKMRLFMSFTPLSINLPIFGVCRKIAIEFRGLPQTLMGVLQCMLHVPRYIY